MSDLEHEALPRPKHSQRLIRLKEVQHRVGLGRSTIYRWMADERFPKPVHLGGHAVAWVLEDVEDWIAKHII